MFYIVSSQARLHSIISFYHLVVDFLMLAGPVTTVTLSPVTKRGRQLMLDGGATEDEISIVPYLANTMTVEPWTKYEYDDSLRDLPNGVYYMVSPKVELNRLSGEVNAACFWNIEPDALSKSDFGAHNVKMATFMHVFLDECRRVATEVGAGHGEMKVRFGQFPEDDYPLLLLGPMSESNKQYYKRPLQVLPHGWIHLLFWEGCCSDCEDDDLSEANVNLDAVKAEEEVTNMPIKGDYVCN